MQPTRNNSDGSSHRGQCIFFCQPCSKERDTKGLLRFYGSHKIIRTVLSTTVADAFAKCYGSAFYRGLWMDMTAQLIEVHLGTDANNLVMTAAVLPQHACQNQRNNPLIQMLRQEGAQEPMARAEKVSEGAYRAWTREDSRGRLRAARRQNRVPLPQLQAGRLRQGQLGSVGWGLFRWWRLPLQGHLWQ